jgi:outer membrane protein OmpA-like peptidoglycan-associated protein
MMFLSRCHRFSAGVFGGITIALYASTAFAANQTLDIQLFHLAPDGRGFFSVESGDINPHKVYSASAYVNYASHPLQVKELQGTTTTRTVGIVVKNRTDFVVAAALGLFDVFEIGLSFPVIFQGGYQKTNFDSQGLFVGVSNLLTISQGDLRLLFKTHIWNNKIFSLAMVENLAVPTGAQNSLATNGTATFEHMFALSAQILPKLRSALNLAYRFRDHVAIQSLVVDDEIVYKWAIGYTFFERSHFAIEGITEIYGQTPTQHPFSIGTSGIDKILREVRSPAEIDWGARLRLGRDIHLLVASGVGLSTGYGAPLPRVIVGLTYFPIATKDRDGDGISDEADRCPDNPEDKDSFQDGDGCPDPDNDSDGILDVKDKCPNAAEDKDSFADEDGCPDPDNDKDGILDVDDKCPNEAGVKENHGCPAVFKKPEPELVKVTREKIELRVNIKFQTAKADLKPESTRVLNELVKVMLEHPYIKKIRIEGNTDAQGIREANIELSRRRAEAVREYLIAGGVEANRMETAGYGPDKPVATNATPQGREHNRRVDILIIEQDTQ